MGGRPPLPVAGQPAPMGPDEFRSASVPNVVTFRLKDITPPSPIYIQVDDVLQVVVVSVVATTVTITINYRLLLPTGVIVPGQDQIRIAAGSSGSIVIPLAEGFLLSVAAVPGGSQGANVLYAHASIKRGALGTPAVGAVLFADYITNIEGIGWPGGRQIMSAEGPGNIAKIVGTNPGAGADWTIAAPGNVRMRVLHFSAQFVTSAVAGNRTVQALVVDSVSAFTSYLSLPSQNIPASTTAQVSATGALNTTTLLATDVSLLIPPTLILGGSDLVGVRTAGILAGDQWSNIVVTALRWIESI